MKQCRRAIIFRLSGTVPGTARIFAAQGKACDAPLPVDGPGAPFEKRVSRARSAIFCVLQEYPVIILRRLPCEC